MTSVKTKSESDSRQSSGKYAGKSASTRQRERKAQLLQAGINLIGKQGYAAATVEAVCSEAKLTKRYFYQIFGDRETLLIAAYTAVYSEFMASILAAAAPYRSQPRELVQAGLTQVYSFVQQNPDKARVIMVEGLSARGGLGKTYNKSYNEFVSLLVSFTEPFLGDNKPNEAILTVMAKGAVGVIIHLCQEWMSSEFEQPMQELITGTQRIFAGLAKELSVAGW